MKNLLFYAFISLATFSVQYFASEENRSTNKSSVAKIESIAEKKTTTSKGYRAPQPKQTTYKPEAKPLETIDYYTNSFGETVQSPTLYSGRPSGATALCYDNTYSFSRNRRGTCSRHGGVKRWY